MPFIKTVTRTSDPAYYVGKNFLEAFMKNTKLTVTFHIGGKQVDELTDEQLERMAERLSETMSRYYSNHRGEFAQLTTQGENNE